MDLYVIHCRPAKLIWTLWKLPWGAMCTRCSPRRISRPAGEHHMRQIVSYASAMKRSHVALKGFHKWVRIWIGQVNSPATNRNTAAILLCPVASRIRARQNRAMMRERRNQHKKKEMVKSFEMFHKWHYISFGLHEAIGHLNEVCEV